MVLGGGIIGCKRDGWGRGKSSVCVGPPYRLARKEGLLWISCILRGGRVHAKRRLSQREGIWLRDSLDGHNLCLQLNGASKQNVGKVSPNQINRTKNVARAAQPVRTDTVYTPLHTVRAQKPGCTTSSASSGTTANVGDKNQSVTGVSLAYHLILLVSETQLWLDAYIHLPNPAARTNSPSFEKKNRTSLVRSPADGDTRTVGLLPSSQSSFSRSPYNSLRMIDIAVSRSTFPDDLFLFIWPLNL
jgi:hypothetical protein